MTRLADVNTADIREAIHLGCQAMGNAFNSDDDDIPYGGASVRSRNSGAAPRDICPGSDPRAVVVFEEVVEHER